MGKGEREGVIFQQVIIKSLKEGIWKLEWPVLKHFASSFSLHTSIEESPQQRKFNEDESCKIL
jgi:hypothetical protein